MRGPAILASAFIFCSSAHAAPVEPVTTLFAMTCMKYFTAPDELKAEMQRRNAPVIDGQMASFFLHDTPGTAWAVRMPSGKFIVSWRNEGVCSVFAQEASVADAESHFTALVSSAPAPLTAVEQAGVGPNAGGLHSISYAWRSAEDPTELLFTLTTSTEAKTTVRAMASMGVVMKANN